MEMLDVHFFFSPTFVAFVTIPLLLLAKSYLFESSETGRISNTGSSSLHNCITASLVMLLVLISISAAINNFVMDKYSHPGLHIIGLRIFSYRNNSLAPMLSISLILSAIIGVLYNYRRVNFKQMMIVSLVIFVSVQAFYSAGLKTSIAMLQLLAILSTVFVVTQVKADNFESHNIGRYAIYYILWYFFAYLLMIISLNGALNVLFDSGQVHNFLDLSIERVSSILNNNSITNTNFIVYKKLLTLSLFVLFFIAPFSFFLTHLSKIVRSGWLLFIVLMQIYPAVFLMSNIFIGSRILGYMSIFLVLYGIIYSLIAKDRKSSILYSFFVDLGLICLVCSYDVAVAVQLVVVIATISIFAKYLFLVYCKSRFIPFITTRTSIFSLVKTLMHLSFRKAAILLAISLVPLAFFVILDRVLFSYYQKTDFISYEQYRFIVGFSGFIGFYFITYMMYLLARHGDHYHGKKKSSRTIKDNGEFFSSYSGKIISIVISYSAMLGILLILSNILIPSSELFKQEISFPFKRFFSTFLIELLVAIPIGSWLTRFHFKKIYDVDALLTKLSSLLDRIAKRLALALHVPITFINSKGGILGLDNSLFSLRLVSTTRKIIWSILFAISIGFVVVVYINLS